MMAGLHECPRCGYRFEDGPSLTAHLDACTGCAWGRETGRMFIYDDLNCKLVVAKPDHDEFHVWTEYQAEDGDYTYVSDHEGYALDSEEFGPFTEDEVLNEAYLRTLGLM